MAAIDKDEFICCNCSTQLQGVYAHCVTCSEETVMCQKCVAVGTEFGSHKNNHNTLMMRLDLAVLEDGWTAAEELSLLNALIRFGPNDWDSICEHMGSERRPKEVKEHYVRVYQNNHPMHSDPVHIVHSTNIHDPPRFNSSSILHSAFCGYNAARGDFQTEYDNDAEKDISSVDAKFIFESCKGWSDEENKLISDLFFSVLDNYHCRLVERKRHHKVISEHGLIQPQKNFLWLRRFDDSNAQWRPRTRDSACPRGDSQMVRTLSKFAQFLSACELDKLLESLKLEGEYKYSLNELCELRRNGVTSFVMRSVYLKFSRRRENFLKERRKYLQNPLLNWRNVFNGRVMKFHHVVNQPRRPAPPLNISQLPGCDKLSAKERALCSIARIVPDSFLEFKNLLVAECLKLDGLRLVQARSLIKIDVNKTRKLYDFLIQEGIIHHPQIKLD